MIYISRHKEDLMCRIRRAYAWLRVMVAILKIFKKERRHLVSN